jgi:hypothetical protein
MLSPVPLIAGNIDAAVRALKESYGFDAAR